MAVALHRIVAIAAVCGIAGSASAQIPWAQPSGGGTFFTFENGQNLNGYFGNPFFVGDTFYFTPSNFTATAIDGGTVNRTDTFEVDLHIRPELIGAFKFDAINITEFGDYGMTFAGPTPATPSSVDATGILRVDEIGGQSRFDVQNLDFPALPASTLGTQSGNWQGDGASNLTLLEGANPFQHIHIKVTNNLIAISGGPGQVATISKKAVGGTMAVTILPAPGTAGLLGAAGLIAIRRRRRS